MTQKLPYKLLNIDFPPVYFIFSVGEFKPRGSLWQGQTSDYPFMEFLKRL